MTFSEESYYQADFSGLSLADETIKSIIFEECTFRDCTFISTRFENCRFSACKFTDCALSAVIPLNCRIIGISFTGCKLMGIDWTRTQKTEDLSFKNCHLDYSNFGFMKLPNIIMSECEVKDVDFTESNFSNGDFKNTDFEKSRFLKTNLTGADFKGARNYAIDPRANTLKKTRFSYPEVIVLLNNLDIIIE
ncbi:MAG: pentapeptide repeat-containing protein [Spirochaetales bacterium]|nr:pentapeptide repeat-containing protein [Spirochaetales bacterium]